MSKNKRLFVVYLGCYVVCTLVLWVVPPGPADLGALIVAMAMSVGLGAFLLLAVGGVADFLNGGPPVNDTPQRHSGTPQRDSERFQQVSNGYPLWVREAYGGNLDRAMADTDEQVAAAVAAWERAHGLEPQDWAAIGRAEGAPDEPESDPP